MIHAPVPNQVKFLIPELVAEINPLAEPTLEDLTGEDALQDAIADGGVIVNAWDGRPYIRPRIHTGNRTLNGGFDSDTLWTKGAGWTIGAGVATKGATGAPSDLTQAGRLTIGVTYEVTVTVSGFAAGTLTPYAGTTAGTARGANGTFTEDIACAGNTSIILRGDVASLMAVDNVSYRPKSLWRIDTALLRRPESHVDFVMLVTHNLHEVYQIACENALRFFQNTSDALPTTPLETTKTLYGRLGQPWPFISLDGVNDLGTVADHADLDWGSGDGAFEALIYMPDVSGNVVWASRFTDTDNEFFLQYSEDDGALHATFESGAVVLQAAKATWVPAANTVYHVVWTFENGVSNALYVEAVSLTLDQSDVTTGGDLSLGEDLLFGKRDALYFKQHMFGVRQWNRHLSAAEVLALKNGDPVPFADRWGSQTPLYSSDFSAGADGWTGGAATADGNIDGILGVDDTLRCTVDGAASTHRLSYTPSILNVGKNTKIQINYYIPAAQSNVDGIRIFNGSTAISDILNVTGSWQDGVIVDFEALVADDLRVYAYDGTAITFTDAGADDVFYLKVVILTQHGCVLALESDGINSVFGKWFDKANQHHATLTGVDYWHVPDADNPAFFFQAFSSFNSRYLFTQFNELLATGQADTRLGWVIYGQKYGFNFATGGYQASENWPGVRIGETDVGIILAEQKYGLRPSWKVTLLAQETAGWESIHEMLQRITGPLFPFYIIWDYSHPRPVIWQARLDPELPFQYVTGSDPWQGITFGLKAE